MCKALARAMALVASLFSGQKICRSVLALIRCHQALLGYVFVGVALGLSPQSVALFAWGTHMLVEVGRLSGRGRKRRARQQAPPPC